MKGQIEIIAIVIIIVVILGIIYFVFNPPEPAPFTPNVDFKLDKYNIEVNDNKISLEFRKGIIKRLDDENIPTVFVMKFKQGQNYYAVDIDGNKITELPTRVLKGQGAEDTLQFKVFGSKGEAEKATYQIEIELWWNNTKLENKDRILEVNVD